MTTKATLSCVSCVILMSPFCRLPSVGRHRFQSFLFCSRAGLSGSASARNADRRGGGEANCCSLMLMLVFQKPRPGDSGPDPIQRDHHNKKTGEVAVTLSFSITRLKPSYLQASICLLLNSDLRIKSGEIMGVTCCLPDSISLWVVSDRSALRFKAFANCCYR